MTARSETTTELTRSEILLRAARRLDARTETLVGTVVRWWTRQEFASKIVLAIAALFLAANVLSFIGGALGKATTPARTAASVAPTLPAAVLAPTLLSESAPNDANKSWASLKVWQGTTNQETETFTVGPHWRVDWLFSPSQPQGSLQVYVFSAEGRTLLNVAGNTQKGGSDTTFWSGAGTYFLRVNATGGDWKVGVQDLR